VAGGIPAISVATSIPISVAVVQGRGFKKTTKFKNIAQAHVMENIRKKNKTICALTVG
jgi:hypothetical protein